MNCSKRIAIVDDDVFDLHIPVSRLPETPGRTAAIREALRKTYETNPCVDFLYAPNFNDALSLTLGVHDDSYIEYLRSEFAKLSASGSVSRLSDCSDAVASRGTFESVEACIKSVLMATRYVLTGKYSRIFCNIRPPGHHACADQAMGFCIVNNVAIAAKYAISGSYPGISRCAIIDWDVHHGNGTQDLCSPDPNILYMSLHMHGPGIYPETGSADFVGGSDGAISYDNVRNYPMKEGADQSDVEVIFRNALIPKLTIFAPDIIFISCGFDAHSLDPIGLLCYSDSTYSWMTRELVSVADSICGGRIVSVLEGGYNPNSLATASIAHVSALL